MGFIAPIVGALASGAGAVASGIGAVGGALASGVGGALASGAGLLGSAASGIGGLLSGGASSIGGLLGSVLGGGGGISVPGTAGGTVSSGGGLGGSGGIGGFLRNLIPVAAGLATDKSGKLDVSNINVMTPEQARLLQVFSQQSADQAGREAVPFGPSRTAQRVGGTGVNQGLANMLRNPGQFITNPQKALQAFETGIADPARTQFAEETAPRLRASFGSVNAGSSSAFNRQVATQSKNLERDLASQKALFAHEAERQRVAQVLGISQATGNLQSQAFNQQSLDQNERDRQFSDFLRLQEAPGLSQLAGVPLQSTQFLPVAQKPQPSPFSGLLQNFGRTAGSGGFNNLSNIFG